MDDFDDPEPDPELEPEPELDPELEPEPELDDALELDDDSEEPPDEDAEPLPSEFFFDSPFDSPLGAAGEVAEDLPRLSVR